MVVTIAGCLASCDGAKTKPRVGDDDQRISKSPQTTLEVEFIPCL